MNDNEVNEMLEEVASQNENSTEIADIDTIIEEFHKEIPENSKSILVKESTSRFSSAVWYDKIQEQDIMVAGIGGIGSYIVFLLSRMSPKSLFIYDDDTVELANMSGQLFGLNDMGVAKVTAISNTVANYSDFYRVFAIQDKYTEESTAIDIMICGFDNMEARKVYFNKWYNHILAKPENERNNCLYLDGRLSAEYFQIFAIQGNDERAIKDYMEKWLFSDEEADTTICSYKQTSFCANMIASCMVNIFVNFIANMCNPIIPRDVPYYTSYDASTMYFKTES